MSLRIALLGVLMWDGPSSGYDLAGTLSGPLNQVWGSGHSQIYPELARMLDDVVVHVVAEGPRNRRTYAVTDRGRAEVEAWLAGSRPVQAVRSEPALRALLRSICRALTRDAAGDATGDVAGDTAGRSPLGLLASDLGTRQAQVIGEWADQITAARERLHSVDPAVDRSALPIPPDPPIRD